MTANHSDISEIIILIREKQVGLKITLGCRLFWAERRKLFPKRGSTGLAHPDSRPRGRGRLRSQRLCCPATSKAPVSQARPGLDRRTVRWFGGFGDWKYLLASCLGRLADVPAHASGQ